MKTRYLLLTATIILLFTQLVNAQHKHEHPASMAMGATGTTFIGDFHANFINPANLMLTDRNTRVTISIFQTGLGAGGPLADINTYNRYLTGGELLDAARQESMLDDWLGNADEPGKLSHAGFNVSVIPLGVSWRQDNSAMSVALRARATGNIGMSRGLFELGFGGLNSDIFNESRGVNARMSGVTFMELSAGYARRIYETSNSFVFDLPMRIYAGAAPKLLMGFSTSNVMMESELQVSGDSIVTHRFEYAINTFGDLSRDLTRYVNDRNMMGTTPDIGDYLNSPSDVGSINATGFGFDLGVTAELDLDEELFATPFLGDGRRFIRVGFAITDIGRMSFTEDAASFRNSGELVWDGAAIDQDRLRDEFDSSLSDYFQWVIEDSIGTDLYLDFQREGRDRITAALPAGMHLGMQFTAGKLTTALDLSNGFNRAGVNTKMIAMGFGVEYRLVNILPVRFGFNTGGSNSASYTFGLGLNTKHYDFDVGFMVVNNSKNAGTWIAAGVSALKFRF